MFKINNNNNLICIAPVCAKRLQWRLKNNKTIYIIGTYSYVNAQEIHLI